jgi:hypothetical protein
MGKHRIGKCGPTCVSSKENKMLVAWTLAMQEVGLSITL